MGAMPALESYGKSDTGLAQKCDQGPQVSARAPFLGLTRHFL
jgi:hypothetical protein